MKHFLKYHIKKSDIENNMDLSRIGTVSKQDLDRVENKYKSNYFGYELLGQKMICKAIIESQNIENGEEIQIK